MSRIIITIDSTEVMKEAFADRYEDYLVSRSMEQSIAKEMRDDFLNFLNNYDS